jgi:hypothetical protein
VTAEGPTGAPLRQQIAEAIHATLCETCHQRVYPCDEMDDDRDSPFHMAADAVVALLNLTEETAKVLFGISGPKQWTGARVVRYVTPWRLRTPPDTSSPETA